MSQIEFSRKTGISQSTISDWKRKKTNPAADKIMLICETLNVTPYELLQDTYASKASEKQDYVIISEGNENYELLVEIDSLDRHRKERLKGYLKSLTED